MRQTTLVRFPLAAFVALLVLGGSSLVSADEVTYQNDGWVDNTAAGFQGGFVSGEIGAAVFVPEAGDYPVRLKKVRLLFGGGDEGSMREVGIKVWRDTGGDSPGELLMDETIQITSSTNSFNEIDLTASNITLDSGNVRIGVAFMHDGFPGIARDDDPGSDFPNRNYIFAQGIGWVQASLLGVNGDWVIRLIADASGPPINNGTPTNNGAGECQRNSDCPEGEVCEGNVCVPEGCAEDRDCADNEACIRGDCVAVDCLEDRDCADGEVCNANFECRADSANNGEPADLLSISSITPSSAPNDEDTAVTIVGAGFTAETTFRVGPTRLTGVSIQSESAALATVPAGIEPGVYNVVANRGADQFSLDQGFIVKEPEGGGGSRGSDGCQVAAMGTNGAVAVFALLALSLLGLRRR